MAKLIKIEMMVEAEWKVTFCMAWLPTQNHTCHCFKKTFSSREDLHSRVLCDVLAKVLSHSNYLAPFIIQRFCWRQALRFPKENSFCTYKWKKAGCEIQSVSSLAALNIFISTLFIYFSCFLFSFISLPFAGTEIGGKTNSENKYC